jgi:Putative transposase/Transposase zinc-binding domain
MKYQDPLKQILSRTRSHWDQNEFLPHALYAFRTALQCRTLALGAEVYASEIDERIVYHTCKSRACPSCGVWATKQWQRNRWAVLPDVPYKGITFTMPDPLWRLFRDNRPLATALPALAASVIEAWMTAKHGLRVGIIAILHTFNGRLEFNSHVHTMVSAGGLRESSGCWVPSVYCDRNRLMKCWRDAVIKLLYAAHGEGLLRSELTSDHVTAMLMEQANRWWSIKIQSFKSSSHFLKYAGRYLRRPPIAERRITYIGKRCVTYWTKDKRLGRWVSVQCSPEEFVDRWAQHIPERYKHAVRCFGLFAPRAVSQTSEAVYAAIGQKPRPRPRPLRWAAALKQIFGKDPLVDEKGQLMHWVRRLAPNASLITDANRADEKAAAQLHYT